MASQVFDMRRAGLVYAGLGFVIPALGLGGFAFFAMGFNTPSNIAVPLAALCLLLLILGMRDFLRFANEAIILDGSQLIYRDLLRRVRLSVPLNAIPHQQCQSLDASGTNERPSFKFIVHTSLGDFPVDSRARGADQLVEILKEQGIERMKSTEFDYRRPLFMLVGYFMVATAIVAAIAIINQRAGGNMPYEVNGVRQQEPPPWPYVIGFVAIWSGGWGAGGAYLAMRAKNERIAIADGQITWTDWRGRMRTRASLSDLRPGSLVETIRGNNGSTYYIYTINTPNGPIKFDQYIRHSRDLVDTINEACTATPLQSDTDELSGLMPSG